MRQRRYVGMSIARGPARRAAILTNKKKAMIPRQLSSHADEKRIATYPHVRPGPLDQDGLNQATKSFDADAPGVTVPMPKSVQAGMAKMGKIFSDQPLWKFRPAQIKSAAAQLAEWRRAYERAPEWDDLFTSPLRQVLSNRNNNYNEGVDAERRQQLKLQSLANRFPASATMASVKAEAERNLGAEETLIAYRDGWRVVKYYYKGKQPTFTLQRFDPKNWEWDASTGYAHNTSKANAEGEFKEYAKSEPLTEAKLQEDIADVQDTLKRYGKTKQTPEQIKAGEREQALPRTTSFRRRPASPCPTKPSRRCCRF